MLSLMMAYLKLFMRQIKNFMWYIFAWLKRFMSIIIRRNHSNNNDLHQSNVQQTDSEMCFNDFVVIEKSSYDADPNGDGQNVTTPNVGKFPNVQSFCTQDYNYSDYSQISSIAKQQQQPISMVSNVSQDKRHLYSQRQQQNLKENKEEEEEDYFQDMVPEFKKPKTIYITKQDANDDELNLIGQQFDQNIAKKFRIQDTQRLSMMELMDETKFTRNPLGKLEDGYTQGDYDYDGTHQTGEAAATTWEDMADEEDLWNNTDETLQKLRIQKREQRLREHQMKKQMKRSKNNR